jgi:peptidoglycan LD-endopeptidase CwlK
MALALVFLPSARLFAVQGWRRGSERLADWASRWQLRGYNGVTLVGGGGRSSLLALKRWVQMHARELVATLAVLVLMPGLAVLWRSQYAIDTFDHTDAYPQDERVAALLTGERLVPPEPLPPEVFTTREVEQVRPLVRYASRDWELLDQDFAQRLLMVYRVMRERHGYDMVLLEGYRSPQRQEQLAALGGSVTRAGAYRSYHQFGLAADSAFLRNGKVVISEQDPWAMRGYGLYGEVAASLGLTWGGGWKSLKDFGHVELRRPGVLRRKADEAAPSASYEH